MPSPSGQRWTEKQRKTLNCRGDLCEDSALQGRRDEPSASAPPCTSREQELDCSQTHAHTYTHQKKPNLSAVTNISCLIFQIQNYWDGLLRAWKKWSVFASHLHCSWRKSLMLVEPWIWLWGLHTSVHVVLRAHYPHFITRLTVTEPVDVDLGFKPRSPPLKTLSFHQSTLSWTLKIGFILQS